MTSQRTLVVICHPRPDAMMRAAAERVLAGLETADGSVRVIDLDDENFDPALSLAEKNGIFSTPLRPPELEHHFEALGWADRIVFVYPTWFSGHPARLKGWFDRVWIPGVAYNPPAEGKNFITGRLRNVRRLDIVTSHGSSKWVNLTQGNSGRRLIFRSLRVLCHPLCRTRFTALYNVDRATPEEVAGWLDTVEKRFAN